MLASRHAADRAVVALARARDDVVSVAELRASGMTAAMIAGRVRRGWLRRVHRGVYVVGSGGRDERARLRAALLAAGPGAVASHRAAAWLGSLTDELRVPEGSVPVTRHPQRPGVVIHRVRATDATVREGLPVTTVQRTLIDLAPRLPVRELERLLAEVHGRRLLDLDALAAEPLPPGLREALGRGPQPTRSEAERLLLDLIRRAKLPEPELNVRLADGWTVDVLWRRHGVAVELDSWAWHGTRPRFERDRRKDLALRAAGLVPVRVSATQITREPLEVVGDLAAALERALQSRAGRHG